MLLLVFDILDYCKIILGKPIKLNLSEICLGQYIQEIKDLFNLQGK